MLTKVAIRNFKCFEKIEIELSSTVVFIGPNNSGKTTALQALALWDAGLRRWLEKREGKTTPEKRPGVTINRQDLTALPVPSAELLWRNLHKRNIRKNNGQQHTENIRIEILVEGVTQDKTWRCGLEFDYANEESFYCRPLRLSEGKDADRMSIPKEAGAVNVALLPPMSGLADREFVKQVGEINFLIGQGRTAEVLRNLCYQLFQRSNTNWNLVRQQIKILFGISLNTPVLVGDRDELKMTYTHHEVQLDLSSAGRGLQQTLLLLAYLAANPGSVLLLDEPDAHLEILRQRQIYQLLTETAQNQGSQIIAASHSEVLLNEAAGRDVVIAFLGQPHRIDNKSQLLKSLTTIGFEQYYQAAQTGWVLYLEGSTDLAILQAWAKKLNHLAQEVLARPFTHYVLNKPGNVFDHFYGLREAKADLVGFALFDRMEKNPIEEKPNLTIHTWQQREIENYFCQREVLLNWAKETKAGVECMEKCIAEIEQALQTLGKSSPWSPDTKVTDDFLDPLFAKFFKELNLPNSFNKTDYHSLTRFVSPEQIAHEVVVVLDKIVETEAKAMPEVSGEF